MIHEEDFYQKKQMCSNNNRGDSSGGGGGRCGCTKKLKAQKIPQRGPGVAELEKILREQHKKEDKAVVEVFSSVSPLAHPYYPDSSSILPPPPPPPPPPPLPPLPPLPPPPSLNSLSRNVHLMQKLTTLNGNNNNNSKVLSRDDSLSRVLRSCQSNFNGEGSKSDFGSPFFMRLSDESTPFSPSPHLLQRKFDQYPHSMMNQTPSSVGLNHHIEHPSNQSSQDNYTSMWPEKEKMVGMKRPWPFSVDSPPYPFLHSNVPPFSSQMNRPDESSTCSDCSTFDSEPGKTIFSSAKQPGQFNLNSKKCNTDYGALDGNILTLGPPPSPMPSTHTLKEEFSKFEFPLQNGSLGDSYQRSGPGGAASEKPFYSFLPPKGQMGRGETSLSLDTDKTEAGGDNVDLNLKL